MPVSVLDMRLIYLQEYNSNIYLEMSVNVKYVNVSGEGLEGDLKHSPLR